MTRSTPEWFADDRFWAASYSAMFPDSRFAEAAGELDQILALTGTKPTRALDLACGPGRHTVALAQRGVQVTGVDQSEFLLDKARSRSADLGVGIEWVRSDMRDFVRPEAFDLALNLFTSFGFFRTESDNQRVLENVFTSLRPGGHFVLDMGGKEVLARVFVDAAARDADGGGLFIQRRRVVDDWSRMENDWMFFRDGAVQSFRIDHWIYSGRELRQMLAAAGFTNIRLFGDLGGRPYDTHATRLVAVGEKAQG